MARHECTYVFLVLGYTNIGIMVNQVPSKHINLGQMCSICVWGICMYAGSRYARIYILTLCLGDIRIRLRYSLCVWGICSVEVLT